jgi:ketol-acid reductoisomerase
MAKQKLFEEPKAILVVYTGSYLGDITLSGFELTTEDQWEEHLQAVEKMFEEAGEHAQFEKFFGSQESVAYDSFEQYKKHFKVIPVGKQVKEFLEKNFKNGFGQFLFLEEIDVSKDKEEIDEIVGKKKPVIPANFFDNLRMEKRW